MVGSCLGGVCIVFRGWLSLGVEILRDGLDHGLGTMEIVGQGCRIGVAGDEDGPAGVYPLDAYDLGAEGVPGAVEGQIVSDLACLRDHLAVSVQFDSFFFGQPDFQPHFSPLVLKVIPPFCQISAVGGHSGPLLGMDLSYGGAKSDARYPCGEENAPSQLSLEVSSLPFAPGCCRSPLMGAAPFRWRCFARSLRREFSSRRVLVWLSIYRPKSRIQFAH